MSKSKLEDYFSMLLRSELGEGIPEPEREWKFHSTRKWRLDYFWEDRWAWPDEGIDKVWIHPVAVEIEGGIYISGRHTRGSGFEKDCEKYNEVALQGIVLLRFTGKMLKERGAECINKLRLALELA